MEPLAYLWSKPLLERPLWDWLSWLSVWLFLSTRNLSITLIKLFRYKCIYPVCLNLVMKLGTILFFVRMISSSYPALTIHCLLYCSHPQHLVIQIPRSICRGRCLVNNTISRMHHVNDPLTSSAEDIST
ncbi:hypothetical protein Hdeb2414_s0019g00546811 [Helianthus debilis subsp. tardiflorus]